MADHRNERDWRNRDEEHERRHQEGSDYSSRFGERSGQQDQFSRDDRQHGNFGGQRDGGFGSRSGGWGSGDGSSWRDQGRGQNRDQNRDQNRESSSYGNASRDDWGTGADFTRSFGNRDEWTDRSRSSRGGGYGGNQSSYGPTSFGSRSDWDRSNRGSYGGTNRGYGDNDRGFWDKATDEVSSWFGDEDAERRRDLDKYRGKGPKNYSRSDDRIKDDVNDRLTEDGYVDATDIEVSVKDREVTLSGHVGDRHAKRRAEDLAERVSGVKHVQNNLRVSDQNDRSGSGLSGTGTLGTGASGTGATSSVSGKSGSSAAASSTNKSSGSL